MRCIHGSCYECDYYEGADTCYMYEPNKILVEIDDETREDDRGVIYKRNQYDDWVPIHDDDDD